MSCDGCDHQDHTPGTRCDATIEHGQNAWHQCLCLNQAPSLTACPPQMSCQGGPLGYTDVWYLQQGTPLFGMDGSTITPDILSAQPVGPPYLGPADGRQKMRLGEQLRSQLKTITGLDETPSFAWAETVHTTDGGRFTHIPWIGPDGFEAGAIKVDKANARILALMLCDVVEEYINSLKDTGLDTEEEREDRLQTERDHDAGFHEHCGVTCEEHFPSDMLRNGILCRAIPGSTTMLDELIRRATHWTGTHDFEQNPHAPSTVQVCRCGKWPDHHIHTDDPLRCSCDEHRYAGTWNHEQRERVRRELLTQDGKGHLWGTDLLEPDEFGEQADAILTVLGKIPHSCDNCEGVDPNTCLTAPKEI